MPGCMEQPAQTEAMGFGGEGGQQGPRMHDPGLEVPGMFSCSSRTVLKGHFLELSDGLDLL